MEHAANHLQAAVGMEPWTFTDRVYQVDTCSFAISYTAKHFWTADEGAGA